MRALRWVVLVLALPVFALVALLAALGYGMAAAAGGHSTLSAAVGAVAAAEAAAQAPPPAAGLGPVCLPDGTVAPVSGLDAEQLANVAVVINTGRALNVPERGWVVALAAARQESGFRADLTEAQSDRDSAGLFQQRRAWAPDGSMVYRMDPANASRMFFTGGHNGQRGLLDIPGWESMSVAQAAQAVQVSAFPDAYAQWESLAVALVAAYRGGPVACPAGNGPSGGKWTMPLPAGAYSVGSIYLGGWRSTGGHSGQDYPAPCYSTDVLAASAGTVTQVGYDGAYGNLVVLAHTPDAGRAVETWYAHQATLAVSQGQSVRAGEVLGTVGSTGNSSGCHLHFEVRLDGSTVDPVPWLSSHGVAQ